MITNCNEINLLSCEQALLQEYQNKMYFFEGILPGTSLGRHVLPVDAALVDQDGVEVLHARQETPVGRRDAARLGAFVPGR